MRKEATIVKTAADVGAIESSERDVDNEDMQQSKVTSTEAVKEAVTAIDGRAAALAADKAITEKAVAAGFSSTELHVVRDTIADENSSSSSHPRPGSDTAVSHQYQENHHCHQKGEKEDGSPDPEEDLTFIGMTTLQRTLANDQRLLNAIPGAYGMDGPAYDSNEEEPLSPELAITVGMGVIPPPASAEPTSNGLAVALPVAERDDIEHAHPVNADGEESREVKANEKRKRNRFLLIIGFLGAIALATFFIIFVVLDKDNDSGSSNSEAQAEVFAVTEPPVDPSGVLKELLPDYSLTRVDLGFTPQARAFEWVAQDPNFPTYSDKRLQQRFALATFYFSTHGEVWGPDWLNISQHECQWPTFMGYGQQYDAFGMRHSEYRHINGSCAPIGTAGIGNSTEIDAASYLEHDDFLYLAMYARELGSDMPSELAMLTNLKIMQFLESSLEGTIPKVLTRLTWLHDLVLLKTKLTGTIPTEFGLMTELRSLEIGGVEIDGDFTFTGTLPSEIGLLTHLNNLQVGDTNVTGTIPLEYFNNLRPIDFVFSTNQLTGTIPTEVGLLTTSEWVFFQRNQFTGTIPSEVAKLEAMWIIYLHTNSLTGAIPSELGRLSEIEDVGGFGLEGQMFLRQNQLTGTIPTELGRMSTLWRVTLAENLLTGPIPSEIGNLKNVHRFQVPTNMLSGTIPTELAMMESLEIVQLFENYFIGHLPIELFNRTKAMKEFRINANLMSGHIPTEIGLWEVLETLELQVNAFSGSMPSELGSIDTLKFFSLGFTDLTGTIPSEFGLLWSNGSLAHFNASDTPGLVGRVPENLCSITKESESSLNILAFDCGPLCGCGCPCNNSGIDNV